MDLLLHNLRTIGTHHCDGTVGEEAAQEIERLRGENAMLLGLLGDAAGVIRSIDPEDGDEALMRQALEALQFSSEYLDELGAKLFPSTKKAKPGSTAWHVQKAMAALRGRLDAA